VIGAVNHLHNQHRADRNFPFHFRPASRPVVLILPFLSAFADRWEHHQQHHHRVHRLHRFAQARDCRDHLPHCHSQVQCFQQRIIGGRIRHRVDDLLAILIGEQLMGIGWSLAPVVDNFIKVECRDSGESPPQRLP
jgi:hypothetical protein